MWGETVEGTVVVSRRDDDDGFKSLSSTRASPTPWRT